MIILENYFILRILLWIKDLRREDVQAWRNFRFAIVDFRFPKAVSTNDRLFTAETAKNAEVF